MRVSDWEERGGSSDSLNNFLIQGAFKKLPEVVTLTEVKTFPKGAKLARRGVREEGGREGGEADDGGRPGKQKDRGVRNAADNGMKAN